MYCYMCATLPEPPTPLLFHFIFWGLQELTSKGLNVNKIIYILHLQIISYCFLLYNNT